MGRSPRITQSGLVYHVLNRRVMRLPLFEGDGEYLAFERVLASSKSEDTMPIPPPAESRGAELGTVSPDSWVI